eukprot:SAG31_NODE_5987_length_2224_cov_2.069647_2_plen_254_part_00
MLGLKSFNSNRTRPLHFWSGGFDLTYILEPSLPERCLLPTLVFIPRGAVHQTQIPTIVHSPPQMPPRCYLHRVDSQGFRRCLMDWNIRFVDCRVEARIHSVVKERHLGKGNYSCNLANQSPSQETRLQRCSLFCRPRQETFCCTVETSSCRESNLNANKNTLNADQSMAIARCGERERAQRTVPLTVAVMHKPKDGRRFTSPIIAKLFTLGLPRLPSECAKYFALACFDQKQSWFPFCREPKQSRHRITMLRQ